MEEIIKSVFITFAAIGTFGAVIKWAIEKYFQKSEEVLKLKEQMNSNAIKAMEKTMEKVSNDLIDLSKNMADLEGHLIIFQSRLNDYDANSNALLKSYIELTNEVKIKLKNLDELEIKEEHGKIYIKKKKTLI